MNELQFIALPDDVLFHIAGKIGEFTSMEYLSQVAHELLDTHLTILRKRLAFQ